VDPAQISAREAEVLAALGAHLSNAQIANRLHISVRTVESHVSALLRKLDAPDRQALAVLADQAHTGPFSGLPASRTTFVGRAADLAAIHAALDESRLVTLVGPGGVGKTRLASVVADEAVSRFPAGGAFVDLIPAQGGSVVRAVADALDATEGPARSIERTVLERLRVGRPLLVLDNCEHVIDAISELVERILIECPRATILATSRQRLGVTGERLVHLAPLHAGAETERLFLDRARAADPDFHAEPSIVADLCARLDGTPLAIELAAARVASLGTDGLLTGLDDQLQLLTGGRGGHPRHHSLRAVIGWSYDLLDDVERAMFRRLSTFVGTFDLDAAAAMSPDATAAEVADLVGRLVDKSLVVRYRAGAGRWRMLDTIRTFGSSQVTALAEDDSVRALYLAWALAAATELESHLDDEWRPTFDEIAGDLRAAALASGRDAAAHRLVRTLAHLTFARGRFGESRDHYRDAAERTDDVAQSCQDLRDSADAALAVADHNAALEVMLAAVERSGAAELRADTVTIAVRYAPSPALPVEDRAKLLADASASADPADRRLTAVIATAAAWHAGTGSIADLDLSRRAVDAARAAEDPVLLLGAMDALGGALAQAGSVRAAHRLADERLQLAVGLSRHDPAAAAEITDAFHVASTTAIAAGDLPDAAALAGRARSDDPIGGHPYIWAPRLVRMLALTGRFDDAVQQAQLLWDEWQRDGAPSMPWMSSAVAVAAMVHGLRAGPDYQLWRSRALVVAECEDTARSPDLAAAMAFVDARVAVHTGQLTNAAELVANAYVSFAEPWWACYARAAGAELAVVAGLPDAADRMTQADPFAAENYWAAACLARARGRSGDLAAVADAIARWEHLDARFERASTLLIIPDRADEGRSDLVDLGCAST
jgi:predicted ATPase/DNA-binding CsgD family transcriptional regulator